MADLKNSSYGTATSKMLNSANETVFVLDAVSSGFPVLSTDHRNIHNGIFYETSFKKTISAGGTFDIILTTPATLFMHYRAASVSASADKLTIQLYEDCSVTGGAAITPFNRDREATAAATMTVVSTGSVTADGTLIHQTFIGGGTGVGQTSQGDESSQVNEWVFKQSTNYCLRVTNGSTGSNIVNVNNVWYETAKG